MFTHESAAYGNLETEAGDARGSNAKEGRVIARYFWRESPRLWEAWQRRCTRLGVEPLAETRETIYKWLYKGPDGNSPQIREYQEVYERGCDAFAYDRARATQL